MASEDDANIGNRYYWEKNFERAIEHFDAAIKDTLPVNVGYLSDLYSRRALCYKEMGDFNKVIEESKQALHLFSDNSRAIYCLAFANFKLAYGNELHECLKILLASAMEAKKAYELAAKQRAYIDQKDSAELVCLVYKTLSDELEDTFGEFVDAN